MAAADSGLFGVIAPTDEEFTVIDADDDRFPPSGQIILFVKARSHSIRRWIEVAIDFLYGHTYGLRRLVGKELPLTAEEIAIHETLRAELEQLEQAYAEADDVPEEVDNRLSEIEAALVAFEDRPTIYDTADRCRAGAFVSIDGSGSLRVERGFE